MAWKVLPANVPHPWKPEWHGLGAGLRRLGPGRLDGDRDDRPRAVCPLALPRDPGPGLAPGDADHQARANSASRDRRRAVPVTVLVPRPGCRWQGRGVAFPRKAERRLECTLMACWEEGYEEPWFLVTDLAPDRGRGAVVRDEVVDRGGLQAAQERRLGVASDADDRSGSGGAAVAGAGGGDAVRAGRSAGRPTRRSSPIATVPEPTGRRPRPAGVGRREGGRQGPARRGGGRSSDRLSPASRGGGRAGRRWRLVSVFRQGLAVLLSVLINGHALPQPSWRPEAWLEIRERDRGVTHSSPRLPIPKNPSL